MRDSVQKEEVRVMGFGQNLRREREMRGVSLEDMADSTKIGTRLLKALEDEQFDLLPGGIFNKGFVRAYAKYLGIDEEAAIASYLEAAGEQEPDVRVVAEQNSKWDKGTSLLDNRPSQRSGFPIIPVLILVAVVAAGFAGWHIYQQRQTEREHANAVAAEAHDNNGGMAAPGIGNAGSPSAGTASTGETAGPGRVPGTPTAATSPAQAPVQPTRSAASRPEPQSESAPVTQQSTNPIPGSTPTKPSGAPFDVAIRTKDRAWVSITIDGDVQTRGVLAPGETRNFHANDKVVLWTGNAGAVEVSYNGTSVPVEGGPNEVRVLVFTPKGVSQGNVKPRPVTTTPPGTTPPAEARPPQAQP